jgi:RecB family exonuclease
MAITSTPTTTRVSSSEIDTYRQCRLKHQLSYIERWRTDEEHPALARGTMFHSVLEKHYKMIQEIGRKELTAEDLFHAVAPLLYEEGTGAQSEQQEIVEWIYRGYVDHYGLDRDWDIVDVERPLDFPLGLGFNMAGTVDLVVRDRSAGGGLWIVDHKTCKDLPKKDFDLEDQTAVYSWLLMQAGLDIRGAIYNHCRTYKLKTREMGMDERFKRTHTVRTPYELETCAAEVLDLMQEAYSRDLTERDAPRSPDGERCGWKCNFTEACLAGRKYGPERMRTFLEDTGFTQHDTKPGPTFNK